MYSENKQLINAMTTVISGRKLKDQDCGLVCYDGRVFMAEQAKVKAITKDGEYYFAGFKEVKMEDKQCCGNCTHHHKDSNGEWYCSNVDSDNLGLLTAYDDRGCFDWEERDL